MKRADKWAPILRSFCVGLLLFLGVLVANSFWTVGMPDIFRLLSDACIVPAVMVGGVGVLVFASGQGTFDMLSYGFQHLFDLFRPNARNEHFRDFYEYKQLKGERRRPVAHMLIVGTAFFVLSWIFSCLWRNSF